ncbi:MAG: glycosyltransferase family 87 protein [Vicinamibacterales bacterium]
MTPTRRPTTHDWGTVLGHPFTQIAFGVGAVWLLAYNYVLLLNARAVHWNDFGKFYYATANWESGKSLYAPTVATAMWMVSSWRELLNLNPPHFHLLLLPLANVSLEASARIWLVANALAATASIALVVRELKLRVAPTYWLPLGCLCLASVATGANSISAQCTGLLMLPMTLSWLAARRGAWGVSGAWLGVLISVKPFLGLFLPTLVLLRQWRALMTACLAGAACVAVGVVVFGVHSYIEWARALRDVSWVWASMNGSMMAIAAKSFAWSPYMTPFAERPGLVTPLWLAACGVIAAGSSRAAVRSLDHAFGVTVLASLLISPLGWTYYLWLAMPGCFGLWQRRMSAVTWVGLLLLCVPMFGVSFGQPHPLATLTVGSSYNWGTLALWLGAVTSLEPTGDYGRAISRKSPFAVAATSNEPAGISTTA